jgi:hypothetical protein
MFYFAIGVILLFACVGVIVGVIDVLHPLFPNDK